MSGRYWRGTSGRAPDHDAHRGTGTRRGSTSVVASGLPELERSASPVSAWWPEILAFIQTGITNAESEGTNRVINTVARDAYGVRNPVSNASALGAPRPAKDEAS